MPPLLHRFAAVGFVAAFVALSVLDAISWRRTRGMRVGHASLAGPTDRAPPPHAVSAGRDARTSRTTFLAGAAGLWAMAYGATTPGGIGWTSWAIIVAGGFIAMTGLTGRVRVLRAGQTDLVIRYAARPPLVMSWTACRELRPPRTFLGSWRVIGAGRRRSLMPSDLLRNEWLLAAIIGSARLSFTGRSWVRHSTGAGRSGVSPTA
jgi:hypothetical protein